VYTPREEQKKKTREAQREKKGVKKIYQELDLPARGKRRRGGKAKKEISELDGTQTQLKKPIAYTKGEHYLLGLSAISTRVKVAYGGGKRKSSQKKRPVGTGRNRDIPRKKENMRDRDKSV